MAIVKRETKRKNVGKHLYRELNMIYMDAYKIIRNFNRTEKDNLRLNPIFEHTWLDYYQIFGLNNLMITSQKGIVQN